MQCGQNDEQFAELLQQGYAFYRQVGTRGMTAQNVTTTPIDNAHWMARVAYRYVKPDGAPLDLDFEVSYMLVERSDTYEIFAFVTGDEMALYREHGLLPDANAS